MKYADILPTDVPQTEALDERQVRNNGGAFVLAIDDWTRRGDLGQSAEFAGVRCGAVPAREGVGLRRDAHWFSEMSAIGTRLGSRRNLS